MKTHRQDEIRLPADSVPATIGVGNRNPIDDPRNTYELQLMQQAVRALAEVANREVR